MKNEIIIYEKKFKLMMSDKTEHNLNENEMMRFEKQIQFWWIFKKDDWTLINPSFFITAKPYEHLEMSEYEARMIEEKNKSIWWKATTSKKIEWLEKLRKKQSLFN